MINPKDKFSRVLYTVSSSGGQSHKIFAVDPFNNSDQPRLVADESDGEIKLIRRTGEHFFVLTSNESLIKLELNEESATTMRHVYSLAQVPRQLLHIDDISGVSISENLIANAKEVISTKTGYVTPNDIGDKIIYSDQNMLVTARFLPMQGIKI